MQLAEVGKLLAIIRSFDNRRLDESTARAWKIMIDKHVPDAEFEEAQEVVLDWFAHENPYFEVRHLLEGLRKRYRRHPAQVEADVRSAKARGLVDQDWPSRKVLPFTVAKRLDEARRRDREVAPDEIEGGESPLALDVGRRL